MTTGTVTVLFLPFLFHEVAGAVGKEGGLGEDSAICPSPVVLSITFLFLRLHVEIWGSEHLNPGLIPLGYSQARVVGGGDAETGTCALIRS